MLGDQLSLGNPALGGADRVLLIESERKLRSARFHRQKVHLVLSAMRHFAAELERRGTPVDYRRAGSFAEAVDSHRRRHRPEEIAVLEPSSGGAKRTVAQLPGVRVVSGTLFLTHPDEFRDWAEARRRLVMEDFYRWQRRRLDILMEGDEPAEGRWNFDPENRRPPPRELRPAAPYTPREDDIDAAVRRDLDRLRLTTFGRDAPRRWPAKREEARRALVRFVERRLPDFGPYQDGMLHGERFMWHSQLSSSLNLGLLGPLETAEQAASAYRSGEAPIASVEGFIRQVIGWREYVWGIYWLRERKWFRSNALRARTRLPRLLWGEPTEMRCIADAVQGLEETAYSHHIVRLMLFGNLMLLLGVTPRDAFDWFHHSFIDGYEWVMAPNAIGMATWADGGAMMTKPYAASGRYIDRMSDYCGECRYDPAQRTGSDACPYTTLYWDFLDRNRRRLAGNRRMRMPYRNLDGIDREELREIRRRGRAMRRDFDA